MEDLGLWLVEEVCLRQAAWPVAAVRFSINLSDRQMRHLRFLEALRGILTRTGADPHRLEFEISEEMLVQDTESCIATVWELREIGIGLVIDDFGSGVTSRHNLRRFPIQSLKVDSRYVRELEQDAAPMNAIVGMSHSLHLSVIAKGVETWREMEQARACGCDEAQGFLICPPLPLEEIVRGGSRPGRCCCRWNKERKRNRGGVGGDLPSSPHAPSIPFPFFLHIRARKDPRT